MRACVSIVLKFILTFVGFYNSENKNPSKSTR